MTLETRETRLEGEVEVDGAVFGGQVRPANARDDRISLELVAELVAAHHSLLASELAKKASTRHGAIQCKVA